ncbi:MAG: hypothetical protein Q4C66_01005 [Lachnospiraceae bacterium]|nr:hypothetical protein [Lachnospiraceae bacterium]
MAYKGDMKAGDSTMKAVAERNSIRSCGWWKPAFCVWSKGWVDKA